jgi:hypothetical protein
MVSTGPVGLQEDSFVKKVKAVVADFVSKITEPCDQRYREIPRLT